MHILEPLLNRQNALFCTWLGAKTAKAYQAYREAKTAARLAVRKAKSEWYAKMASIGEEGRFGEKKVWDRIRTIQISKKGLIARRPSTIKDLDGNTCTSVEAQHQRWREHFSNVLNVRSRFSHTEIARIKQRGVDESLGAMPTLEELTRAVKGLQNGKLVVSLESSPSF